jgi:hypothetical protein
VNARWRDQPASTAEEFLDWLKNVQALVMRSRSAASPGEWKHQNNQSWNDTVSRREARGRHITVKVWADSGTREPVARALMTMFVVSEVHLFLTDEQKRLVTATIEGSYDSEYFYEKLLAEKE